MSFQLKDLKLTAAFYLKPPDGAGLMLLSFFCLFPPLCSPMTVVLFIGSTAHSAVCLCASAVSSQILDVTHPPEGISCTDSHHLLAEMYKGGESIRRLSDQQPRLCNSTRGAPGRDLASSRPIFAMLPSRHTTPSAVFRPTGPRAAFKLRTGSGHKGELCDSDRTGS